MDAQRFGSDDVHAGDWIRFRSAHSRAGRLAEVHAVEIDAQAQSYAITSEGRITFDRILELRRRPLSVVVFPRSAKP